ncbi:hypothetical protein, partial [Citrobacter freundii]|uniref:hypothetical protein n=1 Tax=Citrobacter freundii TaxID=546 RepID=UPI003F67ABAC
DVPSERETEIIAAARAAGIGLYPVSALYDPGQARSARAGFILGYAGLDADALRKGIGVLKAVLDDIGA